ncbi:MAG: peptidoglycan-binding domain-containing protein [Alphaproteobacteria bacterium]|jgi:peptidoglycan hydrolase-like protein with peptidoglycan-binding domain|nr:peptidoglycan-binding domain-containing protein [Alphaproteobacteria bacterium]
MMLRDLGYRPGPVDGLMGRRTGSAIKSYQRDRGLAADGRIDESLVASLRGALASMRRPARSGAARTKLSSRAGVRVKLESLEGLDKF